MKASRRSVRCGVVVAYCCQTCWAISAAEAFVFRVAGPEERGFDVGVVGVEGVAEVDEAAWRLGGMVLGFGGCRVVFWGDTIGISGIGGRAHFYVPGLFGCGRRVEG